MDETLGEESGTNHRLQKAEGSLQCAERKLIKLLEELLDKLQGQ